MTQMQATNISGDENAAWKLDFTVNGRHVVIEVDPRRTLLDLLRTELGLTGTKGACLEGECGSCTVLLDGCPVNSCLTLAGQVNGRQVTTIEGLAHDGELHILQRKFIDEGAVQCGYCTPGLILAAKSILDSIPACTEEQFLGAMEGNICRCTGYSKILRAVREAYREIHEQGNS
jgi:aerobic carbon-monoxide dehydrogenase small subunit